MKKFLQNIMQLILSLIYITAAIGVMVACKLYFSPDSSSHSRNNSIEIITTEDIEVGGEHFEISELTSDLEFKKIFEKIKEARIKRLIEIHNESPDMAFSQIYRIIWDEFYQSVSPRMRKELDRRKIQMEKELAEYDTPPVIADREDKKLEFEQNFRRLREQFRLKGYIARKNPLNSNEIKEIEDAVKKITTKYSKYLSANDMLEIMLEVGKE